MFLGTDDIWALKTIHEEILPLIPNGIALAQQQYKLQFPRCDDESLSEEEKLYDDRNIKQIAQVKEDLQRIVIAITNDPCTEDNYPTKQETIDAINLLRAHLAPKEGEVIQSGLHSPPEIMRMIQEVYDQNFDVWSLRKARLYSRDVIGQGEAVATAVDAQCYKNGWLRLNMQAGPDRTCSYFTPSGVPAGLGNDFHIDVYDGVASRSIAVYASSAVALQNRSDDRRRMGNLWRINYRESAAPKFT